jgi:RHS repeat-associated protein
MTLALVAIFGNTAFAAFPAAMPEFKNEKQLATWRAEQASKADTRTAEETHAFYTGKPYVDSSGGYAFLYRSYNPELARWTSEDPSGFPDGANGYISVNNQVTNGFDPNGLWHVEMTCAMDDDFYNKSGTVVSGPLSTDAYTLTYAVLGLDSGCGANARSYYTTTKNLALGGTEILPEVATSETVGINVSCDSSGHLTISVKEPGGTDVEGKATAQATYTSTGFNGASTGSITIQLKVEYNGALGGGSSSGGVTAGPFTGTISTPAPGTTVSNTPSPYTFNYKAVE